jgi:hypothetical protein
MHSISTLPKITAKHYMVSPPLLHVTKIAQLQLKLKKIKLNENKATFYYDIESLLQRLHKGFLLYVGENMKAYGFISS